MKSKWINKKEYIFKLKLRGMSYYAVVCMRVVRVWEWGACVRPLWVCFNKMFGPAGKEGSENCLLWCHTHAGVTADKHKPLRTSVTYLGYKTQKPDLHFQSFRNQEVPFLFVKHLEHRIPESLVPLATINQPAHCLPSVQFVCVFCAHTLQLPEKISVGVLWGSLTELI